MALLLIGEPQARHEEISICYLPLKRGLREEEQPSWSPFFNITGDYQGLVADDHLVHPLWNDTRTGTQEIFTAAVPGARP